NLRIAAAVAEGLRPCVLIKGLNDSTVRRQHQAYAIADEQFRVWHVGQDFTDGPLPRRRAPLQLLFAEPLGESCEFPGSGLLQAEGILPLTVIEHALRVLLWRFRHDCLPDERLKDKC